MLFSQGHSKRCTNSFCKQQNTFLQTTEYVFANNRICFRKQQNMAIETLWFSYYNNLRYEMKMIHHSVESFYVKEKFAGKMQNICDGKRETENGG